jgi:bis(5'-nucleosyl)-tetraphosphatase (symmetrical)
VAIGDVQGCFDCLEALVARIDVTTGRPSRLWLTGDLVNRGPKSLETLRWAMANEARVATVLGNHDLHLLAVAAGIRPPHRSDTLAEILAAPDVGDLLDWLRRRPLAHLENGHLMVHAGVLPQWSGERTLELAAEVQQVLAGPRWTGFLRKMYGNEGALGRRPERRRPPAVIVNALTRLRFARPAARWTSAPRKARRRAARPARSDVPGRASAGLPLVVGHWSKLGLVPRPDLIALDTGCVWGGALTGVRLDDREVFSLACPQAQVPGRKAG